MKRKITEIATVHSGIYAQSGVGRDLRYIQARHFDQESKLSRIIIPELPLNEKTQRHLLQAGDILVSSKGGDYFAAEFEGEIGPAVASTTFLVLRLKGQDVLPQYLVWFLNHPQTQAWFETKSIGSAIQSISKGILETLEVPIPSIEVQHRVLRIHELRNKERLLRSRIEEQRERLIQQEIFNAIT